MATGFAYCIKNLFYWHSGTMLDDWFSALTILASEHDIVDSLNSDETTGRFALSSTILQKHLNVP